MKKLLSMGLAALFLAGCAQPAPAPVVAPTPDIEEAESYVETAEEPANRLESILESGVLTMVTAPGFAPFTFVDPRLSGQESIVGSDLAFGRFIAERLGVELDIQTMDFPSSLAAVQMGTVDINLGGISWTQERTEAMMLSTPYNPGVGFQGIILDVERAEELSTAGDFDGLTIAVQNGTLQYNLLIEQLPEAVPQLVTAVPEGILMVLGGQVDGLAIPSEVGDGFISNYPQLIMSDFQFDHVNTGQVMAMPLGSYELFEAMEEIIAYVIENDLYATWFAEALALSEELTLD